MHLVLLLEEQSMENVLKALLPKLSSQEEHSWELHSYFGKKNLLKQLPKLLRAYSRWIPEHYRIIIIVDQDRDDCSELKQSILSAVYECGLQDRAIVRIVVVMLETWYLGDPNALVAVFPKLKRLHISQKAIYRQVEARPNPAEDIDRVLKSVGYDGYLKVQHSIDISPHLNIDKGLNRAHSFGVTIESIRSILA